MKTLAGISLLIAGAHCAAATVSPPFYSQPLPSYSKESSTERNSHHLRLFLSSEESVQDRQVILGSLTICSKTACFQSAASAQFDLSNNATGTSTLVADIDYPDTAIDSIYFGDVVASKRVSGRITLLTPLMLEPQYRGAEIMVVLSKDIDNGRVTYVPRAVATNLLRDVGVSIFYNPKYPTAATLPFGTSLAIPPGATSGPSIFNVAQHDTGGAFPLVDIYPSVDLAVAATLKTHRLARGTPDGSEAPATPAPRPATSLAARQPLLEGAASDTTNFTIRRTGVLEGNAAFPGPPASVEANSMIAPNAYTSCAANLSAPVNQQVISNALITTGTTYLNWCTTVAPYIHIAVTNILDSRERFTLPHVFTATQPLPQVARLALQPITYWGPHTQVLINGFTWDGDAGSGDGQVGFADGYAFEGGWFGANRVGGGATSWQGTDSSAGNKIVMGFYDTNKAIQWAESSTVEVVPVTSNHLVSSSTSIMKNGVCATDTLTNSWSAFGSTTSGRLIFISSTSSGQTSAAELCPIFQALGANYALRLDGGPSAAMTIDGKLLNPLTGLASIRYGTMRHIAYPLKIAYQGW